MVGVGIRRGGRCLGICSMYHTNVETLKLKVSFVSLPQEGGGGGGGENY